MIGIFKDRGAGKNEIFARNAKFEREVENAVREIIDDVKLNGDAALFKYCEKFDGARLKDLRVSKEEIDAAYENEDERFLGVLRTAKKNIEDFHKRQRRGGFEIRKENGGIIIGQKTTPIERVGVYVPGGTASYPSAVLMNVIPAKIAGVKEIVMATPPNASGGVPAAVLCAAKIAGVDVIVKSGGAQAIAALAYGTRSVPKVDKIAGPGNAFVAAAKKAVFGVADIDAIAGPSEILILADASCNPRFAAADLLAQAEHDKLASAVLVTDCEPLAYAVQKEIDARTPSLPRREIAEASIEANGKIIVVASMERGIEIVNETAPEHLEICVGEPFALLDKIKNAGSIFLGENSPEALGDYMAGPNHVLPTAGAAKFSSPLSADDFIKKSSYLYYSREALERVKDDVALFADREGFRAHAESATVRFEK